MDAGARMRWHDKKKGRRSCRSPPAARSPAQRATAVKRRLKEKRQ
jgi:hypothetical protein